MKLWIKKCQDDSETYKYVTPSLLPRQSSLSCWYAILIRILFITQLVICKHKNLYGSLPILWILCNN